MAILRIDGVKHRTGDRSKTSIYNRVKEGLLTTPVKTGSQTTGWPDYEVDICVAAQVAGQTKEQIRALVDNLHAQRMERFKILMQPLQGTSTTDTTTNVVPLAMGVK